MERDDLHVPELVRRRAHSHGAKGARWLADLPEMVADLASRWQLQLGHVFSGGTASLVLAATDRGGRSCVLKLAMVLTADDEVAYRTAALAHALAEGRGCAQLYAQDVDAHALLLERLGPDLHALGLGLDEIFDAITATLRELWRPLAPDVALPTGVHKAAWLADYIRTTWRELDEPCSRAVVDRALQYCERRAAAFTPTTAVLVHGDAHGWNTLSAGSGRYRFVDIEGLVSQREHDLAVPMREYNGPLLAGDTAHLTRQRADRLAAACDADPVAVWEWGFVERVSTGLANVRELGGSSADGFFEVAERCLREP